MTETTIPAGWVNLAKPNEPPRLYKTVARRVVEFRKQHTVAGGWGITTTVLHMDGERVCIRADVLGANGAVVATGHAEEMRESGFVNKTSALENCETGAIGRALAACGFGGSDTEYASADEMIRATQRQRIMDEGKMSAIKHRKNHESIMHAVDDQDGVMLLEAWDALTNEEQGWIWQSFRSWERTAIKKLMALARTAANPQVEPDISGAGGQP